MIGTVAGIGAANLTASLAQGPILLAPQTVLLANIAAAGTGILLRAPAGTPRRKIEPIDALPSA